MVLADPEGNELFVLVWPLPSQPHEERGTRMSTPAGWYDDPERPGQQRYWNGQQWTDDKTRDAVPSPQAASAATPQPSPSGGWQKAIAFGIGGLVIGLIIGAAVVAAVPEETVTPPGPLRELDNWPDQSSATERADPPPPLKLRVYRDGCGVIRSGATPVNLYPNLGWSFRDQSGFEVLQRNALAERRYRYYREGTYSVALVAWFNGGYRDVSNEVTVSC